MNEAAAGAGGSRVLGIVRKLRAAGMEQPVAEAVGEELAQLPTRAEMREDIERAIELALAKQFRSIMLGVIGLLGLQMAFLVLILG